MWIYFWYCLSTYDWYLYNKRKMWTIKEGKQEIHRKYTMTREKGKINIYTMFLKINETSFSFAAILYFFVVVLNRRNSMDKMNDSVHSRLARCRYIHHNSHEHIHINLSTRRQWRAYWCSRASVVSKSRSKQGDFRNVQFKKKSNSNLDLPARFVWKVGNFF